MKYSTYFGQVHCPSSGVSQYYIHAVGICYASSVGVCKRGRDGTSVLSWSCSQAVSKPVWQIPLLCVQWKTTDDWQRNCPKHVEFHSKNKFGKLMRLVSFNYKKFNTMHGHMNVKISNLLLLQPMHNYFALNIKIYVKIYNNCSCMFRFWLNHHQGARSLSFAKLLYWYQLIYWVIKIVRSFGRMLI